MNTELSANSITGERQKTLGKKKKKNDVASDTDSKIQTDSHSFNSKQDGNGNDSDESVQLNLPYIINELGCNNIKVRRDQKLLDQFLLLKAVIDSSLPKLKFNDIKIFQHICNDVFLEISAPELSNKHKVREVVENTMIGANMSVTDDIVYNVLNLHQAMLSRHGIMCIGPSMSGKTTAIKTLTKSLQTLH